MKFTLGTLAIVSIVGCCVASTAHASEVDEGPTKREHPAAHGEVLINPLGVIFGSYGAEIGIGLADGVSLNPSVGYISLDSGNVKGSALGLGLGVQVFPGSSLYHGWFLLPHLAYASAKATSGASEATATAYGGGILAGYQWDWRPFTLRLGAGAAYYAAEAKGDDIKVGLSGVAPELDASIGFSF
jgi:hypothetical protein